MKVVTYILILLLLAGLGGAAYFYLTIYKPMDADYGRMKSGMPELDKAKVELKKYKDRESWIKPTVETLKAGLSDEINAGKAEVGIVSGTVVINIKEDVLYTPNSITFAKDSPPIREKIASLLKNLKDIKDKEIIIGNVAQSAPSQGRGRRKIPAKEARELAAQRSLELVKYLEKNGVPQESLAAAAYPAKQPDRGFKIKEKKTIIVIGNPQTAEQVSAAAKTEAARPQEAKPAPAANVPQAQPKSIPILPAPPKTQ